MEQADKGHPNPGFDGVAPAAPAGGGGFLDVGIPANNGHTYVYEPDKSLNKMTVQNIPSEDNYRKLSKMYVDQRPTMEELMLGEKMGRTEEESNQDTTLPENKPKGKVVKFGWIEGVFMRCLLNIWGVMLFLRLTWVIGQSGMIQGLLVITLCNVVTGITALSMSAVATNGQIASGGVYYMISRALGPEFGGAIGIMFTVANSISVATYTLGFVDNVFDLIYDVSDFGGFVATPDDRLNDIRWIGTIVLVLILGLAIVGMDWVTKVQKLLLVILIFAQIDMFVGSFISGGTLYADSETRHAKGFTGWSMDTVKENINSDYTVDATGKDNSFMSVFGVFFTAVTGIVAGANLSGDLKDPAYSIPKGTLYAIIFTYMSYIGYGVLVAFTFVKQASGNVQDFLNFTEGNGTIFDFPSYMDCSSEAEAIRMNISEVIDDYRTDCIYGTAIDQKVMTLISYTGYLVYGGCYGATLSSAIASLVGAPRVLQAVGKDRIYPKLEFFAKGSGANNDPFRGYILVFIIAFGCLMIGDLNSIGKLASNFFLAAYALMNLSVFHSSMTKSPGWRPSFKFYNPWVSLLGAIVCGVLMFLIDWVLAVGTVAAISMLYAFMLYLKPETNWGSSADALVFMNALNNSYSLNEKKDHIKTYRPKILLMSGNPAHRKPLIDFGNLITKKMSLLICGHILPENSLQDDEGLKETVQTWFKDHNIKSFYTVQQTDNYSDGVKNMISMTGIGKLAPNMVLMGFKASKDDFITMEDYFKTLTIILEKKMSVGILRLPNGCDYSAKVGSEQTIVEEEVTTKRTANNQSQKENKTLAVYRDALGRPLPKPLVDEITQFSLTKKREGVIDVYWLYDDGGLTLLLPHILQTRKQFGGCKLRVFSLSNRPEDFDKSTISLSNLLAKFRIDYTEVVIIPDITKKAMSDTKTEFEQILKEYGEDSVSEADITANSERTNRHLRTAEILRENSMNSELVVMTLPLPRKGQTPPLLYMAWLDIITRGLPPVLLTRGNQTSVLTFYS